MRKTAPRQIPFGRGHGVHQAVARGTPSPIALPINADVLSSGSTRARGRPVSIRPALPGSRSHSHPG